MAHLRHVGTPMDRVGHRSPYSVGSVTCQPTADNLCFLVIVSVVVLKTRKTKQTFWGQLEFLFQKGCIHTNFSFTAPDLLLFTKCLPGFLINRSRISFTITYWYIYCSNASLVFYDVFEYGYRLHATAVCVLALLLFMDFRTDETIYGV